MVLNVEALPSALRVTILGIALGSVVSGLLPLGFPLIIIVPALLFLLRLVVLGRHSIFLFAKIWEFGISILSGLANIL